MYDGVCDAHAHAHARTCVAQLPFIFRLLHHTYFLQQIIRRFRATYRARHIEINLDIFPKSRAVIITYRFRITKCFEYRVRCEYTLFHIVTRTCDFCEILKYLLRTLCVCVYVCVCVCVCVNCVNVCVCVCVYACACMS